MSPGTLDYNSPSDDDGSSSTSSDSPPFREAQRLAAIRGEGIPSNLDDDWNRASVIRGIRVNYAYATSADVINLCSRYADIARARNARLIMSNVIPDSDDMLAQDSQPYCIWYPDFATQETYRELVRRFPSMRYQVGRACAAAGWDELYQDLDLLPDVCVAEEDDRLADECDLEANAWLGLDADEVRLLYEPLPDDLPTVKKAHLIQMAAFEGNVDRYVRLARPELMSTSEHLCVLRGIYHNTMFARFWAAEIDRNAPRIQRLRLSPWTDASQLAKIKRAISARRIMMNDTEEFSNGWPPEAPAPFMIWWPRRPCESTLLDLAEKAPQMREQIAIASIICDYPSVYSKVDAPPSSLLWMAAKLTPNTSYLQDLEAKAAAQNMELGEPDISYGEADTLVPDLEPTYDGPPFQLKESIESLDNGECISWQPFEGGMLALSAARVERYVWASPALLRSVP